MDKKTKSTRLILSHFSRICGKYGGLGGFLQIGARGDVAWRGVRGRWARAMTAQGRRRAGQYGAQWRRGQGVPRPNLQNRRFPVKPGMTEIGGRFPVKPGMTEIGGRFPVRAGNDGDRGQIPGQGRE